jgi:hypothetical protein
MGPSDPGLAAIEANMLELKAEHERRNAKPAPQNSGSASMADLVRQSQTGAQFSPPQEDPAPAAVGTTVATFSATNGTEWRIVTGPAGKHNAVLFDTDANESVDIRVFSGADSLEKSTEYARGQAEEANRREAQPAAPAPTTERQIPPAIQARVEMLIDSLREKKSMLADVERARGNGHILSLEWGRVKSGVEEKIAKINKLRATAVEKGLGERMDRMIESYGGVPDFGMYRTPDEVRAAEDAAPAAPSADTSHLVAIMSRLSNERARLAAAKTPSEIAARTVIVNGIERELKSEYEFLGMKPTGTADISDDDLAAELGASEPPAADLLGDAPQSAAMGFSDYLKTGRLQDAVELLAGMSYEDSRHLMLMSGFSMPTPRIKTTAKLIEEMQGQLVAAAQFKTDGFGLKKARED